MKTRTQILNEIKTIEKIGGVYKWYMTKEGAYQLGIPLNETTIKNGLHLVYVGLSKDMRMRLQWHTGDKHRPSSIKSGTLSVLRQKLNTLLTGRWDGKEEVDQFMDQHMKVEFEYSDNYETLELREIQANRLPLNARNNPNFTEFRRELSKRNGQAKRNSL
tara:strand:- start:71 stop:553 length:483 start_codon:yes stop_codon:yes gene_type:complete